MRGLRVYGNMINDQARMDAYYAALSRLIEPGRSIVVDIGAGSGIFALLACQLGARRVYAIEPAPIGRIIPQMARDNGYADRIVLFNQVSQSVELAEQADIVLGDLRGSSPFVPHNITPFFDAKQRLLKPDGVILPARDHVMVSGVYSPKWYDHQITQPWLNNAYGLNLTSALPYVVNQLSGTKQNSIQDQHITLPPLEWTQIEYGVQSSQDASGHVTWTIEEDSKINLLLIWFESVIYDDIRLTTNPLAHKRGKVYGEIILPLEQELQLKSQDTVNVSLAVKLNPQGHYEWGWQTTVLCNDPVMVAHHFKQSTIFIKKLLLQGRS